MDLEALPRYDGNGGAKLGESVVVPAPNGRYVALEDVRAYLAARGQAEGWRLVPVEPTREMIAAFDNIKWSVVGVFESDIYGASSEISADAGQSIYRAMLAAAPPAPEPGR